MNISLSQQLIYEENPIKFTAVEFNKLSLHGTSNILDEEFNKTIDEIQTSFTLETLAQDKQIKLIRNLFKSVGTDPSRWRPSSEAMLRRIIKLKNLYRINPLVDINNIVSLKYRIPIGLYDSSKLNGDIAICVGQKDEEFPGLTGRKYNAEKKLILKDNSGIIGSPIVDSERCKITQNTTSSIAILFSHIWEPVNQSKSAAEEFIKLAEKCIEGAEASKL